jgi:recombinational DNA repair protein (RecF pathway)
MRKVLDESPHPTLYAEFLHVLEQKEIESASDFCD